MLFALLLVFAQSGAWALEADEYNFDYKVEAVQENKTVDNSTPVNIQPMTAEAIRDGFSKLPPLPAPSKQVSFEPPHIENNRNSEEITRIGSPSAKRTKNSNTPRGANEQTKAPLTVNCSHHEEVEKLTQLKITFSQPMVNLYELAYADEKPFLTMSPPAEGKWYWTSQNILVFDPLGGAIPNSTEYEIKFRREAKSLGGAKLEKGESWKFFTPRVRILKIEKFDFNFLNARTFTDDRPILFCKLNQNVKRSEIMKHVRFVEKSTGRNVPVSLYLSPETAQKKRTSATVEELHNGFYFQPKEDLKRDSVFELVLETGAPSAEGPLLNDKEQRIQWKSIMALKIVGAQLSEKGRLSQDGGISYSLKFDSNNSVDDSGDFVHFIPPAAKKAWGGGFGYWEYILQPDSKYKVVFSKDLKDKFGQSLGKDLVFDVHTGPVESNVIVDMERLCVSPYEKSPKPIRFVVSGGGKVRLTVHDARPEDYSFMFDGFNIDSNAKLREPVGPLLFSEERECKPNGSVVEYDLRKLLSRGPARYVVGCELIDDKTGKVLGVQRRLLQITNLVMAVHGSEVAGVFVGNSATGTPVVGAKVGLVGDSMDAVTNEKGIAYPDLSKGKPTITFVEARTETDLCLCRIYNVNFKSRLPIGFNDRLLAFTDRNLYRPGESLAIKGYLRALEVERNGDVRLVKSKPAELKYFWYDARSKLLKEGVASVDEFGGFSIQSQVPATACTGRHNMSFVLMRDGKSVLVADNICDFEVQEFRRPEFEVKMQCKNKDPIYAGEKVRLCLSGSSLSGGKVRKAKTTWTVNPWAGAIYFDNFPGYSFNPEDSSLNRKSGLAESVQTLSDDSGISSVDVTTLSQGYCGRVDYRVTGVMQDVTRQERSDEAHFSVLPAEVLVGVSAKQKTSLKKRTPNEIACNFVAVDKNGDLVKDTTVDVTIEETSKGKSPIVEKHKVTIADKPTALNYQTSYLQGEVRIVARVVDSRGRVHKSSKTLPLRSEWPESVATKVSSQSGQNVSLALNKGEYAEGESAELTLTCDIPGFAGTVIVAGATIHDAIPFEFKNGERSHSMRVPLGKFNSGQLRLVILPADKFAGDREYMPSINCRLKPAENPIRLTVRPLKDEYRPGEQAEVAVDVKNQSAGSVDNARVALAVVDDAVLHLNNYKWPSPPFFLHGDGLYPFNSRQDRGMFFEVRNSRIVTGRIGESGDSSGSGRAGRFKLRSDLTPLAYFIPSISTDNKGQALASFKMPGNITRYKIFALASKDFDQFAGAEGTVLSAMKLAVKPSAPRFLNYRDDFELPLVVHNQTDSDLTCSVVVRATNIEVGECGKIVTVPAGGRSEVRFPAKVRESGKALVQCAVSAGELSDSTQFEIPVYKPIVLDNSVIAGAIDSGSVLQEISSPLAMASGVNPQLGGLTVSTSTSAFPSLKTTFDYFRTYPYTCTEQLSSRIIALLSMRSLMKNFSLLSEQEEGKCLEQVDSDLKVLLERQQSNGGFAFWSTAANDQLPFASAQAVLALHLAKQVGRAVPPYALQKGLDYLATVNMKSLPASTVPTKLPILSKILNVRYQCGIDTAKATRCLLADCKPSDISPEVAAWLIPTIVNDPESQAQLVQLKEQVHRSITQTNTTATIIEREGQDFDYESFTSSARADAAAMEALMACDEKSPLIGKLVKGLLDRRENGIWVGTQANSYVAQALVKYFQKYESQVPNFEARTFLDDANVDSQKYVGRTTKTHELSVPMSYLVEHKVRDLQIDKVGTGRLYYNLALSYAPKDQKVAALSHGFVVEREYRVRGSKVVVTPSKDGAIHIKAGSTIDVSVQIKTHSPRFHTVLCDNFPAGLEPVFGSLSGSQFSHMDLRDHAAQAFATVLRPGLNSISYSLQATTPGKFNVPPCRVEEMYAPDTFARTAAETVIVE